MVPTVSDPKTWVPYMNTRDCSQGFCSLYCPQWCYIIFPPPPPFDFPEDNNSGPSFSPLVIAIIGILASAFLLVSYYAIMSKYCGNRRSRRRGRGEGDDLGESDDSEENQDPSIHGQPWNAANTGLDEALIKSITVFKYKKGDGVVIDGSDCPVCLSEFQEDENLRLLPKCSHAFHVSCIDTWLKSHSNCPLCRSNIVFLNPSLPPPIMEPPPRTPEPQNEEQSAAAIEEEEEAEGSAETNNNNNPPNSPARDHHTITIREDNTDSTQADSLRRRSVSMDSSSCQGRLSIADILRIDHDEECSFHDCQIQGIGSSKQPAATAEVVEISSHRRSVLMGCVISPAVMHRSFSSGRFFFPKLNRPPNTSILPS